MAKLEQSSPETNRTGCGSGMQQERAAAGGLGGGFGGGKAREQGAMLLLNQSTSVQLQEGRRLVAGTALGNVK